MRQTAQAATRISSSPGPAPGSATLAQPERLAVGEEPGPFQDERSHQASPPRCGPARLRQARNEALDERRQAVVEPLVARPGEQLVRHRHQVGNHAGGQRSQAGRGVGGPIGARGRVGLAVEPDGFPGGGTRHVHAEGVIRSHGIAGREAGTQEDPDGSIEAGQRGRASTEASREEEGQVPPLQERAADGAGDRRQVGPPLTGRLRGRDLGGQPVEGQVEKLLAAGDVAVQRHGPGVELTGHAPHREPGKPLGVEDGDGRGDDALTTQRVPRCGALVTSRTT